jgi:hypothetical protein
MLALQLHHHHIIDLYCLVDDLLPRKEKPKGGRPTITTDSELVTALLWNVLTVHSKTLKDVHNFLLLYHRKDFPKLPRYSAFVYHCHRVLPDLFMLLETFLADDTPLRFMDSTMIEVCKLIRAESHKVAKSIATFGKNHQGWHYGFKLHMSIDPEGRLSGVALTPANIYDAQAMIKTLNKNARIAVGDTHYGAKVMGGIIWKRYGTIIIAPLHPKQKKKIMAGWQHFLLTMRPKIEAVFDVLKEHLHLVTSFPRSVSGYILHYARILVGYQLMVG